jgi:molybdate transport system substrate-binding protein
MRLWLSAVVALTLVLVGSPSVHAQEALTVSIVSRGDDGFKELIAQFEAKTGRKVNLTFPNFLASRDVIVKGEPFDLAIVEFPHDADVIASGNVDPNSATLVANGWMALAVRKGAAKPDISTPAAVKRTLLAAKSIAFPDPEGASGRNIEEMLRRLGIADEMQARITHTRGGRQAMAAAASGEVEIGMTMHIGMYGNDDIDIVGTLPPEICPPGGLIAFISSKTTQAAAARELLAFLTAPEAAPVYRKYLLEPAY